MLNKTKEFAINLKNGLKMVIRKYNYSNISGTITMFRLKFAYYVGKNKITNFTSITFRDLAQKLKISADKLAYFLDYNLASPHVRGRLGLN